MIAYVTKINDKLNVSIKCRDGYIKLNFSSEYIRCYNKYSNRKGIPLMIKDIFPVLIPVNINIINEKNIYDSIVKTRNGIAVINVNYDKGIKYISLNKYHSAKNRNKVIAPMYLFDNIEEYLKLC